jgi:hypothetical protein
VWKTIARDLKKNYGLVAVGRENSFVNVDGSMMQSVSGGGHSGGGVL